ncbi:MAG: 6-phosphofructokinase, partial [Candidatus Ornithomonoglobus sp.]
LRASQTYPSVAYKVADELGKYISNEIRVTVPGHFQRGGSPCAYDRVLCTRFGAAAARLIKEQNYGNMVGLRNGEIVPVPLSEVAGKLKKIPADCPLIGEAREVGISFGD